MSNVKQAVLLDVPKKVKPDQIRKPKAKKREILYPGDLKHAHMLIVKDLEHVNALSHKRYSEIWDDFNAVVLATLEALPHHLASALRTGQPAEDTPETKELWTRINRQYDHRNGDVWNAFSHAFHILLQYTDDGLWSYGSSAGEASSVGAYGPDLLGHTYMLWASGDPKWSAQYFTPWTVAYAMAQMTIGDGGKEVQKAIFKALEHPDNVAGQAVLVMTGLLAGMPENEEPLNFGDFFYKWILPVATPYLEPVSVCDPAVGSGIMLLAAAACYPEWAVKSGLVQFYGQDIDYTCTTMTKINCLLYGLNGSHVRLFSQLTQEEIEGFPARMRELYAKALEVEAAQISESEKEVKLTEIKEEIKASQLSLF